MSADERDNSDGFLSEEEKHFSKNDGKINSTVEAETPVRDRKSLRRTSGFTGAPVDANGIMIQELQTLLRSVKAEAKTKGDSFQRIRGENPGTHKTRSIKSLFGNSFTPKYTHENNSQRTERLSNDLKGGFVRGFPWANDLGKICIPKLERTDPGSIITFQRKYRCYVRAVRELEERYSSRIRVRSVYSCIIPRALHYLCFMTELIPKEYRNNPEKIDRGVIHQVIMNYIPIDSIDFTLQLDEELNRIQINLWPNGLASCYDIIIISNNTIP